MQRRAGRSEVTVQGGQRTAGELVGAIREAIVRGDYSPNERLVEYDLAEAYAASRAAVRAALIELSIEGLVERETNRGARVRAIGREEAIEIAEVRMALESVLAGRAARRATPEETVELSGIVASMEAVLRGADVVAYSDLGLALHRRIHEIARHASAARILERLRDQSVRIQRGLALVPGRVATSLEEHRGVVEAIVAGDSAGAEVAMRTHLARVVEALTAMDGYGIR